MPIDYKYYDFQVYEYLIRLEQMWKGLEDLPEIKRWKGMIEEERDRIQTRKFRVAVVGEFRKGKSSFINALLGKEILPVDALPTTATINRITYGPVPRAFLRYKDKNVQEVPIEELSRFVTKLTTESQGYAALIEEAVVEYPSIFCQNYVDLIDTPGMNDDDVMNQVTLDQLEQIDLAIVAISVQNPFSETESRFVAQLLESEEICQIVIVVTKIDQARERERTRLIDYLAERIPQKVLEKLKETHEEGDPVFRKYEMIFSHLPIFGVCSLDALEARQHNDEDLFVQSGFQELNERLPQLILTSQNNSAILKAIHAVKNITEEYPKKQPLLKDSIQEKKEALGRYREEFSQMAYQLAEEMFDETRVKLYEKINDFSSAQSLVRREFITCLSSIKEMNAEVIETMLKNQEAVSKGLMDARIQEQLNPELKRCWREESGRRFQETVGILSRFLQRSPEEFASVEAKLQELFKEPKPFPFQMGQWEFTWSHSPVPQADHLLDGDMIIGISQAIFHSLEDYCGKRKAEMERLLKEASGEAASRLESVVSLLCRETDGRIGWWNAQEQRLTGKEMSETLEQLKRENEELERQFTDQFAGRFASQDREGGEKDE